MAGMTRAQFQRTLFPGIREIVTKTYREKPGQFMVFYNMLRSTSAFEEDYTMAGVGLLQRWDEDTEVPSDRMYPGLSIRYDHIEYALKIPFSRVFIRDGKYPIWNERGRELGFSARQTEEVLHADLWNNGNTTNGYDGVPLFSASHPLIRGGGSGGQLQSNILATPSTLNVASLRDMLTQSRLIFDETGVRRIQVIMRKLMVPPQLEFVAKEIVNSTGRPDTANRADNVTKGSLEVHVWDYLLNAKAWFMQAEKSQHKIKHYDREKFNLRTYMEENTETNVVRGMSSFSYGWSDYKGNLGTYPT